MKVIVYIIVASVVISLSLQQSTQQCSTTSGPNSEALKYLSQKGLTLRNIPEKLDSTVCNGEFARVGTCCELEGMKSRILASHNGMLKKWSEYILQIGFFKGSVMKGVKKMLPYLNGKFLNGKIDQLNAVGAASKLTEVIAFMPTEDESASDLKKWAENFDAELAAYKQNGKGCFEKMRDVRANVYCAMCSADASLYTSPQSQMSFRYKISLDSCKEIANKCYSTWKFNFNLATLTQLIVVLKSKKLGKQSETNFRSDEYIGTSVIASLRNTFNKCILNDTTKTVSCGNDLELEKHLGRLCSIGIVGNKHLAYTEGDANVMTDLKNTNIEEVVESEVAMYARRRVLQSGSEPSIHFEVSTTSTFYANITKSDSEVVPAEIVDTSTAGDNVPKWSWTFLCTPLIYTILSILIIIN